MKNTEVGLFPALEAALRAATEPVDAQALFDMPAIKEYAASVNRVSDYLGNLWRKGLVVRQAAPRTGTSRTYWTYTWKGQQGPRLLTDSADGYSPRVLIDRPTVLITEEGRVITLDFPNLSIRIQQKPAK